MRPIYIQMRKFSMAWFLKYLEELFMEEQIWIYTQLLQYTELNDKKELICLRNKVYY